MYSKIKQAWPLVVLAAILIAPTPATATNGMYLTSYGAETLGRGGANLAIADRSLALNFNPAGISQLQGNHFTANLNILAPSLEFENMINSSFDGEDAYFPLPSFAYVRGAKESPWTWGVGFVAQGGMGATFENMNTFFGTQDETFSEVRFMTITPTLAYAVNDDMAFGATVNLGYADTLSKRFTEKGLYNVVLANPPFKGSIDHDSVHRSLTSVAKTKKTELLFLVLMQRMLKTGGRCAVIVPDGVLFGSSKAHQAVRRVKPEGDRLGPVVLAHP